MSVAICSVQTSVTVSADNQITLQQCCYCHKVIFKDVFSNRGGQTIHTMSAILMCLNYPPVAGRDDKAMRRLRECLVLQAI